MKTGACDKSGTTTDTGYLLNFLTTTSLLPESVVARLFTPDGGMSSKKLHDHKDDEEYFFQNYDKEFPLLCSYTLQPRKFPKLTNM